MRGLGALALAGFLMGRGLAAQERVLTLEQAVATALE